MRSFFLAGVFVCSFVCLEYSTEAQEVTLPAGTLLNCTLDEPNFSSASAEIGEPTICQTRGVQQFGRTVFPRGAYLAGRLVAEKDPGHFLGKGWLKLEFDRISLPDMTLPVPAKIVAVRGYRVDKEGKIIGHGHATRDAIEWLIPPLWPWKLLTLPARGPRPTLKGETQVTLRLMDDVTLPPIAKAASRPLPLRPKPWRPPVEGSARPTDGSSPIRYLPPSIPAMQSEDNSALLMKLAPALIADFNTEAVSHHRPELTLIALKDGAIYGVTDYWAEGDRLYYALKSGTKGTFDLDQVDWGKTTQIDAELGIVVSLRARPKGH
jgi:hypothetical protein